MHEIGIAQGALDQAIAAADKAGAKQIHELKLRIGAMSGVVPEALAFAFEALRQGTIAASAELKLESVPARYWCRHCEAEFTVEGVGYECPRCHQFSNDMRSGRELEIVSMEVS